MEIRASEISTLKGKVCLRGATRGLDTGEFTFPKSVGEPKEGAGRRIRAI